MKFDVEHPNWRLPYLQDASNLPSSNIPSIRWYNAPTLSTYFYWSATECNLSKLYGADL